MPPPLTKPFRRLSISLYEDDCIQLERRYGRGWAEQVRILVERNCKEYLLYQRQLRERADAERD